MKTLLIALALLGPTACGVVQPHVVPLGPVQLTVPYDCVSVDDWFITMVDRKGFSVRIHPTGRDEFEVSSDDARPMISLLLQRQRQKSGLSLAQAAQRLGAKSRNAYARYEQGVSVPTVEKLDKLLRAIAPDRDIVVRQSHAA